MGIYICLTSEAPSLEARHRMCPMPSMPSSARAAAPACRRAEALEVRYRAVAGVGEEAHSRQRHWCPWSKPVNVETWGHVPGPVVMAHALAELRYGIVARQNENGFKCGHNFAQ